MRSPRSIIDQVRRKKASEWWPAIVDPLAHLPLADRNDLIAWLYEVAAHPEQTGPLMRMSEIWSGVTDCPLLEELLDRDTVGQEDYIAAAQAVISTTVEGATGVEDVYRDAVWRIARINRPEVVLRYDPRLADLRCLDSLDEALFFASKRILWIVERHGVLVATMRRYDDEDDAVFLKQPELIEIAACPSAWKILPTWLQSPIWDRLLAIIKGEDSVGNDRRDIRRLGEKTFRARVDRAGPELLEELVEDCPFWLMSRYELLKQEPSELRRWHRLLRLPKENRSYVGVFARSLRHAAGLIETTEKPDESDDLQAVTVQSGQVSRCPR
jgi:hypothetical protein